MKKLFLYIFSILVFCNFTNTANAKVDGEGELYLSQDVIKNFIKYIKVKTYPHAFYVTIDGNFSTYYTCKVSDCSGGSSGDIKYCEKKFNSKCKRFAKKNYIKWKNDINPGKGKTSKINKKWSDTKIYAKLVELSFVDENDRISKKSHNNFVYKSALYTDDYENLFILKDLTSFKNLTFKEEKKISKVTEVLKYKDLNKGKKKTFRAFSFIAEYENDLKLELLVEYDKSVKDLEKAEKIALFYSKMFGQIPHFLRINTKKIYIHKDIGKDDGTWWVGNQNKKKEIIFHINPSRCTSKRMYSRCVVAMIHEITHILDREKKLSYQPKWLETIKLDKNFYCSKYAKVSPREDFAESVLCWIAVRHKSNMINKDEIIKINQFIPNRLKFFDDLNLNMHPWKNH